MMAIVGSTRADSSNLRLVKAIADLSSKYFTITIFDNLSLLPHFNPYNVDSPPKEIIDFYRQVEI
jgi:chromate reductase